MLKTIINKEDESILGYQALGQAIILTAITDYSRGYFPYQSYGYGDVNKKNLRRIIRKNVKRWIEEREGSFDICAMAWNKEPKVLQEILLKKIEDIDNGKNLKL